MVEQEPTLNSNMNKDNERSPPLSFKEAVMGSLPRDVYFEDIVEVWSSNEEDGTMMSHSQALDLNQDQESEDPMCPNVVIPPKPLRKLHNLGKIAWLWDYLVRALGTMLSAIE